MKVIFNECISGPSYTIRAGQEVETSGLFSEAEVARLLDKGVCKQVKLTAENAKKIKS